MNPQLEELVIFCLPPAFQTSGGGVFSMSLSIVARYGRTVKTVLKNIENSVTSVLNFVGPRKRRSFSAASGARRFRRAPEFILPPKTTATTAPAAASAPSAAIPAVPAHKISLLWGIVFLYYAGGAKLGNMGERNAKNGRIAAKIPKEDESYFSAATAVRIEWGRLWRLAARP